jgi:O-antigen/teichoic acid export membrane protein
VGAVTISVVGAFLVTPIKFPETSASSACVPASFREGFQAILFSAGQVLINNVDILLVKLFFSPEDAGLYAAVALFGRLLYYSSWAIITAMFPVSAGIETEGKGSRVLLTPFLLVLGMSVAFVIMLLVVPNFLVTLVFGESFVRAGSLLALYATATALYSLSVVLITYEMSRKIANTGWLQLVMGGVIVLSISVLHQSLRQVILIQIVVMIVLLATVSLPFLRKLIQSAQTPEAA